MSVVDVFEFGAVGATGAALLSVTALCSRVPSNVQQNDISTPAVARREIRSTPKRAPVVFKIFQNFLSTRLRMFPRGQRRALRLREGLWLNSGGLTSFEIRWTQSGIETAGQAVEKAAY